MNYRDNNDRKRGDPFLSDLLWYSTGSIVPAVILMVRLPIFTRIFSPEEYGFFTLVFGTYTYLSLVLFSWISSCLWRFYAQSKAINRSKILHTNLLLLTLAGAVIMLIITIVWASQANQLLVRRLILFSFLQVVSGQVLAYYLIIVRINGKAFYYNLLFTIQSAGSFALLLLLAFPLKMRIEAILIGQFIINLLLVVFLLIAQKKNIPSIALSHISKATLREYLTYGSVGLVFNFGLLLLASSDRYLIAWFTGISETGIYNQVYLIGQYSIYQLITVYFNTINPYLIRILSQNKEDDKKTVNQYVHYYFLIFIPITYLLSLYSKQIAWILLGPEFRAGYTIIPYIMVSSFIYGLTQFNELKLKFAARYKRIIIGIGMASLINIALNIFLIPIYGYQAAAVTTLLAFCVLFLYLYAGNTFNLSMLYKASGLKKTLLLLIIHLFFHLCIRHFFYLHSELLVALGEGIIFCFIYILLHRKAFLFSHTHPNVS